MSAKWRPVFIAIGMLCVVVGTIFTTWQATLASTSRANAPGDPLVYVCSSVQGPAAPVCASNQELEVFDHNGAPIWSVGEFGGDAVYGDNRSVFAPGDIFNAAVTISYASPAAYDSAHKLSTSCKTGTVWVEPHGIWSCRLSKWVQAVKY